MDEATDPQLSAAKKLLREISGFALKKASTHFLLLKKNIKSKARGVVFSSLALPLKTGVIETCEKKKVRGERIRRVPDPRDEGDKESERLAHPKKK